MLQILKHHLILQCLSCCLTQLKQLRIEAWKSQDFNGVWTRDLAIAVRRSKRLSYDHSLLISSCLSRAD